MAEKAPRRPVASLLAVVSVVAGLLGLIVIPIPLGIAAIVCGMGAFALGKRYGAVGVFLGVVDIVVVLFLASLV